jgi:uncharacterized cupredoxin-like copper-binding protein
MRLGRDRRIRAIGGFAALALACAPLAGCGESKARADASRTKTVAEHDFRIEAPARLAAGNYVFDVDNEGATSHELLIAPTTTGSLPLRPDGLTVDEEAIESSEPGALEPAPAGARRTLAVTLKPGRYIFFCNMEGHYMAGMHAEVVVQ